jgi:hypothetical protein
VSAPTHRTPSTLSIGALAFAGLALVAQGRSNAQNLVPNPSFEVLTTCPDGLSQIARAAPWDTPGFGTPDAYNGCVTTGVVDVPSNWIGHQEARTGIGYAGVFVYQVGQEYREYLQAPLTRPLATGEAVQVSFHVSLADNCRWAVDRMGAYLAVGAVTSAPIFSSVPQVESSPGVPLADSAGWTEVSGTFTARGGEDHILIGEFHPDADLTRLDLGSARRDASYYFIEDVSVMSLACAVVAEPISGLRAVRPSTSRADVAMAWQADLVARGYNVWTVELKRDIPDARQSTQPPAVGVVGCAAPNPAGSSTCTDAGGVSRAPALRFYQVRAFCDALSEGP